MPSDREGVGVLSINAFTRDGLLPATLSSVDPLAPRDQQEDQDREQHDNNYVELEIAALPRHLHTTRESQTARTRVNR